MKLEKKELQRRKPLWVALSSLFLDTELQAADIQHIAKQMKESGYGLDAIEEILMNEVLPVCRQNLHSPGGEWAGFDENWLVEKMEKLSPPGPLRKFFLKASFGMIREDWHKVIHAFNSM